MHKLREAEAEKEIDHIFFEYIRTKQKILVWQNENGLRLKCDSIVHEFSRKNNLLRLKLDQDQAFSTKRPVYIYGDKKILLFKTTIVSQNHQELMLPTPKLIRLQEMRENARTNLLNVPSCSALIGLTQAGSGTRSEFTFKMIDISANGFSFFLTNAHARYFTVNQEIKLKQLMSDSPLSGVNGIIKHITLDISGGNLMESKQFRVGVQFKEKLKLEDLPFYQKLKEEKKI